MYEEDMKKLLLCVALCVTTTVHASFLTGNDLLQRINSGDHIPYAVALGYIQGVGDAYDGGSHCLPDGVTVGQLKDVVKNFLEASPEVRHRPADLIIYAIFKNTWPCANKSNKGRPGA
jgi:hypothetical protein